MRDIEFRGKAINGEWILESETYIKDGDGVWLSDEQCRVEKVDEKTVGQYTGIKDKNGVKIFEGDLVKKRFGVTYKSKHYPSFADNTEITVIETILYFHAGFPFLHEIYDIDYEFEFEVIGNIHDTLELLQEKDK